MLRVLILNMTGKGLQPKVDFEQYLRNLSGQFYLLSETLAKKKRRSNNFFTFSFCRPTLGSNPCIIQTIDFGYSLDAII